MAIQKLLLVPLASLAQLVVEHITYRYGEGG